MPRPKHILTQQQKYEFNLLCQRFNWRCACCGQHDRLTVDHIDPNDSNDIQDNVQPLCSSCNNLKNNNIRDYRNSPHPDCTLKTSGPALGAKYNHRIQYEITRHNARIQIKNLQS